MDPPSPSSSDDSIDLDDAILSTVALTVTTMIQVAEDEEDEEDQLSLRRRTVLECRREEAYARLVRLYFAERPVFGARDFRRRYRMSKRLFLRITNNLEERYPYFQKRMDARGKLGFMPIHKTTSALRQLAYGCSVDLFDEHLEMSARTSRESLIYFCKAGFYANNNYYKARYDLTDGIYPEYSTFVKTFTDPIDEKRKYFKKKQESARKDIERAFGVLKKRWKVISFPSRFWDKQRMHDVIYACITLHNMILEDEDKAFCQDFNDEDPTLDPAYWEQQTPMEQRIANSQAVRNSQTHNMLLADLVDHLWENKRGNPPPYVPLEVDDYFSDDD
uniref:uncharacterized protein LOC122583361 n=1 Tax=Erigeron canadensis TaxID=72917 RepID=UPI001CB8E1E4|nr:uncharacterized protein LOC122583361 [Erigeron canadensis]